MKVLKYCIANRLTTEDVKLFGSKMKELRKSKIKFVPLVLVEDAPGESKPVWMKLNLYNKIRKKEENFSEENC